MPNTLVNANVELIDSLYAAFGRADVDFIIDNLTPDVSWNSTLDPAVPWAGEFKGRAEVLRFFAGIFDSVEVLGFEPQEYVTEGDTVVSTGTFTCRIKANRRETTVKWIFVFKVRDGKVAFHQQFQGPELAAAFKN